MDFLEEVGVHAQLGQARQEAHVRRQLLDQVSAQNHLIQGSGFRARLGA